MHKKWKQTVALALAGAMLCTALTGCAGSRNKDQQRNVLQIETEMYAPSYWTSRVRNADKVLLSSSEISQLNLQTAANVGTVVDLVTYPSELSLSELSGYLAENTLPEGNLYGPDGGMIYEKPEVTVDEEGNEIVPEDASTYIEDIRTNMNLDGLSPTNRVSYALAMHNTLVQRFPSSDQVFASPDDNTSDLFLQATLSLGEPVVVLHTSADQTWYFVQLRNCRGWVFWSDLVFLEKSAWVSYIESPDFIVVTDASITLTPEGPLDDAVTLTMGTVLPLFEAPPTELNGRTTEGCYVVSVPARDRFGNLEYQPLLVPMNRGVSHGYLPYTYENVVNQAFKLAGERLQTHSLSGGWDANGFFVSVYKTFGIELPYTISEQKKMECRDEIVSDMTAKEKSGYFKDLMPGTQLYSATSAFIYLGQINDVQYILHPAASFFVGDTRFYANSILITRMDMVQESGLTYYEDVTIGRVFAPVK